MRPLQVLLLQVRVDLVIMAMKGYSTFTRTGTSSSDAFLASYPEHSFLWESYLSADDAVDIIINLAVVQLIR